MGNRLRRTFVGRAFALALAAWAVGGVALLADAAGAQLTEQELHFLYELNRARNDPPGWAAEWDLGSRNGGDGQPTTLVGASRCCRSCWM